MIIPVCSSGRIHSLWQTGIEDYPSKVVYYCWSLVTDVKLSFAVHVICAGHPALEPVSHDIRPIVVHVDAGWQVSTTCPV